MYSDHDHRHWLVGHQWRLVRRDAEWGVDGVDIQAFRASHDVQTDVMEGSGLLRSNIVDDTSRIIAYIHGFLFVRWLKVSGTNVRRNQHIHKLVVDPRDDREHQAAPHFYS